MRRWFGRKDDGSRLDRRKVGRVGQPPKTPPFVVRALGHVWFYEERDWGEGGGGETDRTGKFKIMNKSKIIDKIIDKIQYHRGGRHLRPGCPPHPHFQALPAVQVDWGELSSAGAVGQSVRVRHPSIGWKSEAVGQAASEGLL